MPEILVARTGVWNGEERKDEAPQLRFQSFVAFGGALAYTQ